MFRKLFLLFFIVATASSYAASQDRQPTFEATIKELEKKMDIIVDNVLEVNDILIGDSTIDEMTNEEADMLLALLEKQLAKIKKNEDEINEKVSKQDIDNRTKKLCELWYISIGGPY